MSKEYIERGALIDALRKYQYPYGVEFLVSTQPADDVVEVKHGRWLFGGDGLVECSLCEEVYTHSMLLPRNYCPNCGANMRGDCE